MNEKDGCQGKPHEGYLLLPNTIEIEEKVHKEHIAYNRNPPQGAHARTETLPRPEALPRTEPPHPRTSLAQQPLAQLRALQARAQELEPCVVARRDLRAPRAHVRELALERREL
jgi:hypothetical protein